MILALQHSVYAGLIRVLVVCSLQARDADEKNKQLALAAQV